MKLGRATPFLAGAVALVMVTACSSGDTSEADHERCGRGASCVGRTTTTSTTLSPGECFGLIAQAQAGTRALTDADYSAECGPLPAGAALAVTTTTTTTLPPATTTTRPTRLTPTTRPVPPSTFVTLRPVVVCPDDSLIVDGSRVC